MPKHAKTYDTIFLTCKCGEEIEYHSVNDHYDLICPMCKRRGCWIVDDSCNK